jgi:hypothetical protein
MKHNRIHEICKIRGRNFLNNENNFWWGSLAWWDDFYLTMLDRELRMTSTCTTQSPWIWREMATWVRWLESWEWPNAVPMNLAWNGYLSTLARELSWEWPRYFPRGPMNLSWNGNLSTLARELRMTKVFSTRSPWIWREMATIYASYRVENDQLLNHMVDMHLAWDWQESWEWSVSVPHSPRKSGMRRFSIWVRW